MLTRDEEALLKRAAAASGQDGVPLDQVGSALVSAAIARCVRKRTGKAPAKVYSIKRPGGCDDQK